MTERFKDQYSKYGSFLNDVARGKVIGAEFFYSYGDITTTGPQTHHLLWPLEGVTGAVPVPASTGVQMTLVSDSANDDKDAGTGIRSVRIHYLDINLDYKSEDVLLEGLTPVTTVATDIRFIQCVHMLTYGSGTKAAGNISVTNGGTTYSYIAAGERRCTSSARRVPRGKKLMIAGLFGGSTSGTSAAKITLQLNTTAIDSLDLSDDGILFHHMGIGLQDNSQTMGTPIPFPLTAGQIAAFTFTADKAATITAGFFGWLEDE